MKIRNHILMAKGWMIPVVLVYVLAGSITWAQGKKSALDELVEETQKSSTEADKLNLVWWIPVDFWRLSLAEDKTITKEQTEEFVRALSPYVIVAIVDGKIGTLGGMTYKSEAELRLITKLVDQEGASYAPLATDRVDATANTLLGVMKPILANMLGPMGTNMHFFVFPGTNKSAKPVADSKSENEFTVKIGTASYKWKLPLASLLPPKFCPIDQEKMKGDWKFCPYHGEKLAPRPTK